MVNVYFYLGSILPFEGSMENKLLSILDKKLILKKNGFSLCIFDLIGIMRSLVYRTEAKINGRGCLMRHGANSLAHRSYKIINFKTQ